MLFCMLNDFYLEPVYKNKIQNNLKTELKTFTKT